LADVGISITFAKEVSKVPDYKITIFVTIGKPKVGVRWHPSYDVDHVKTLVEKKVRKTLGIAAVKWVEVIIVSRTKGDKMDTKNLEI
jgi:hypothetical protein